MATKVGITKSGRNGAALADNASRQVVAIGTNRKFQVTEVIVTNTHAATIAHVRIFDVAAMAAPTAAKQMIPDILVNPESTIRVEFDDGPIFGTEVSAELEGGTGEVLIYNCQVNGVTF